MDLHGIIRLLLDKSWLIVSCVVLAVIAAAVYVEGRRASMKRSLRFKWNKRTPKSSKPSQVVSEDMRGLDVLNTVAQKLCNTALLQQVLETNRLLPPEGVQS